MDNENKPAWTAVIAEDEAIIRMHFAGLIRSLGGQALQAGNGAEAIRMCERTWPDLCFLDVNMPVLDGIGAARKIRELAALLGRSVYLVAVSANLMTTEERDHFDEVLNKPVDPSSLCAAVGRALSGGARPHPSPQDGNRAL